MGRLDGKVALITGAARGQGRSHAVRLAQEGAQIIGVDVCGAVDHTVYPLGTEADLAETVRLVEEQDARMVAHRADVRDRDALGAAVRDGVAELGRLDIVLANAGILTVFGEESAAPEAFDTTVAVNLTGVFNAIEAALPTLLEQDEGGSIVITSSVAGLHGRLNLLGNRGQLGYTAAKHGLVGLMRGYAAVLADRSIRVNSIHPTGVNTPMIFNEAFGVFAEQEPETVAKLGNAMPVDFVEPVDISNAIAWLCSDEARYVTGVELPVDAGFMLR